jgi:hypothetical protein
MLEMEAGEYRMWEGYWQLQSHLQGYWTQWNFLIMIDGMIKQHWESADGWSETPQVALTQSKVKEVMGQVHGGSSGGHQTLVLLAT